MRKERADKSDKLDVFHTVFSSKNFWSLRRNRSKDSNSQIIPSSQSPKSQITPSIISSTSLISKKSSRITICLLHIHKTFLLQTSSNLSQLPKYPVFMRLANPNKKTKSLQKQRAQSQTIHKSWKDFTEKVLRSHRTKFKMHCSSINL